MKLQGMTSPENIWLIAPEARHASCGVGRAVPSFGQLIRAETEDRWGETESPIRLNHQCPFQDVHRPPSVGGPATDRVSTRREGWQNVKDGKDRREPKE